MKYNKMYWLIPMFLIIIFLLEYFLIINDIEKYYQYNEIVKDELMASEKSSYYFKTLERSIYIVLQVVASILCINIGLIYFNYKVKVKVKKIIKIVIQSIFSLVIIKLLILVYILVSNFVYTQGTIEKIEKKLYLTNYINTDEIAIFLIFPLQTFNITHLLYFFILAFGVSTIIKKNYIKSVFFTFKTYGIGVSIWLVFETIMEMNIN